MRSSMSWRRSATILCAYLSGCDAGQVDKPPPPPPCTPHPPTRPIVRRQSPGPAMWTGPRPQTELVTGHAPSASEIVAFVGRSFVQRNRLKAEKLPSDSPKFDRWTFTYNGVPITGQEAVTSGHVTRIGPVMQDPPAVRRANLISAATTIGNA